MSSERVGPALSSTQLHPTAKGGEVKNMGGGLGRKDEVEDR